MTEFRHAFNAKKLTIDDGEYFEPDTSETEEGQEVNIKTVYERCMRGDASALRLLNSDYDIKGNMEIDDAFATTDPTVTEEFDLADVTAFSNEMAAKMSSNKSLAGRSDEQITQKSSEERVLEANDAVTSNLDKP